MTKEQKIAHYRSYLWVYGTMMSDLAHSDEFIIQLLIEGENLSPFLQALRKRIEDSPVSG